MTPPDVVYLSRKTLTWDALRLSLRSLRNLAHGRVWLAGWLPPWASGLEHLPDPPARARGKYTRINAALAQVAACSEVSERFVYMNDDFFLLEPVEELPPLHRGPIRDMVGPTRSDYREAMRQADALLRRLGVAEPLSYELHVPMEMSRERLREAMAHRVPPGQARTVYGNLAELGGSEAADVKVHGKSQGLPPGPFASTSPGAIHKMAAAGRALRALFPDPSPYEGARELAQKEA